VDANHPTADVTRGPRTWSRRVVVTGVLTMLMGGCGRGATGGPSGSATGSASGSAGVAPGTRIPLPPTTPTQSLGADQPPVIWIGGILTTVEDDRVTIREGSGSSVSLVRLAEGATAFFAIAEDRWERLPAGASVANGQTVCVETLMGGSSLVAIRVFLGVGCGPA
jgi:hypothetical protein